jgi:hypothetical protein
MIIEQTIPMEQSRITFRAYRPNISRGENGCLNRNEQEKVENF